jgi:eukaryotic-like serine/threonine-protein kinase
MPQLRSRARLTPQRRRILDQLLDQLLAADSSDRAVQLAQFVQSHPRVGRWLTDLVAASEQPSQYLDTLFNRAGEAVHQDLDATAIRLPQGTRLGPWRILHIVGTGGMGTVYKAERADDAFAMNVAIKLIRTARDGLDERLQLERELLARLDHRHIARLIDGGSTDDNQTYLVMEWVDGESLDAYLERESPRLSARLDLFGQIAAAVAHAHQRRVVHGDIKPGNVLVTPDGQARLVDFGVGRWLGAAETIPETRMRGLTPAFSAPEQRAGHEPSTQSDVWALGRLLLWLLVPKLPAASDRLPRHRDLAAITDRACAKSPDDRYDGVAQLLDDLRRYRQRLPVLARPATRSYLGRRFVQRHWLAVSVGSLAAGLFCLVVAGIVWQAHVATKERDRATLEAARAHSAEQDSLRLAGELQQVVEFQADQLARIDTAEMGARLRADIITRLRQALASSFDQRDLATHTSRLESTLDNVNFTDLARASLDENIFSTALETIESQFDKQPLVRARLLQTVATSMRQVGLREKAMGPQKAALQIRQQELGPDHLDTLDSLDHLGLLYGRLGRRDDQARVYREVLSGYQRMLGDRDARTLNALSSLGANYNARGNVVTAETYFREALQGQRDILGDNHAQTLITTHSLGYMLSLQGRHEEALPYYQSALKGRRQLYGDEHPETFTAVNNMGGLLIKMGRLEEALTYYQQALDGRRRMLGNEHRATLQSINNMGHLLGQMERLDDAQPLVLEALERSRKLLGEQHPNTLIYFNNAGRLHQRLGKFNDAERLYRQAVEGARSTLAPDHWHTASFLAGHAGTLKDLGRFEQAEAALLEAHEIFASALGEDHERTASTTSDLADLYRAWNRHSPVQADDRR